MIDQFGPDGPLQFTLVLAQDGAAPPTQGAAPSGAGTTQNGSPTGGGAGGGGGAFGSGNFLFLIMIGFGVIILMSILSQRRERKRREAILSAVKKHDRVQTIGGVIGSVVEVKQHTVVLKVDESSNTRMTFARSAIQQVLEPSEESGKSGN